MAPRVPIGSKPVIDGRLALQEILPSTPYARDRVDDERGQSRFRNFELRRRHIEAEGGTQLRGKSPRVIHTDCDAMFRAHAAEPKFAGAVLVLDRQPSVAGYRTGALRAECINCEI